MYLSHILTLLLLLGTKSQSKHHKEEGIPQNEEPYKFSKRKPKWSPNQQGKENEIINQSFIKLLQVNVIKYTSGEPLHSSITFGRKYLLNCSILQLNRTN